MATEITSSATGPVGASVGRRTGQYLLAIDWLSEDADRVAPGEIAARLDVSGASVTEMGSKLEDAGLVTVKKYTGMKLTDKGKEVARELAWRLCVVENFFEAELSAGLDGDAKELGLISGVCDHCTTFKGVADAVEAEGFEIQGTEHVPDVAGLVDDGYELHIV